MFPDQEVLLWMYRKMVEIRAFEEKAIELYTNGRLPGFLHSKVGEEAVPVGVCANLRQDDYITSTHRGHGDVLAKGARMERMMAELFARETGYCRAKGGSMHIADFGLGILGANGIVAAGLPIATGAALSAKMRGSGQVTVAFFGDGASNNGAFHEALNLASVWDLPVVYVCANNTYAESTPQSMHQKIKDVAVRAAAYGIPSAVVDGNSVVEVWEASKEAIERARSGGGPTLLECKTYRWFGHYIGDPGVYRPAQEVEAWKARDPIPAFGNLLVERGVLDGQRMAEIGAVARAAVEEAVSFAESSPEPGQEEALEDVHA